MAIKDNFLGEVKIGNRVELMIGSKEMDGLIVALDLDTVRIRRDNGKEPVLSLDSITYYEVGDNEQEAVPEPVKEMIERVPGIQENKEVPALAAKEETAAEAPAVKEKPAETEALVLKEKTAAIKASAAEVEASAAEVEPVETETSATEVEPVETETSAAEVEPVETETSAAEGRQAERKAQVAAPLKNNVSVNPLLSQLGERSNSFFDTIEIPVVRSFKDVAKMTNDLSLRNQINAIANSIDYAINQTHEISPADYKIQENIRKIKRLIRNYPRSKTPSNLLGAVYYRCKCDGLALDVYENGDDNESAFVIAESYHNEEKKLSFAIRHFVFDAKPSAYIYKFLLDKMIEMDDYSLCTQITAKGAADDKLWAYHSFLRAIFLANEIAYNGLLDFDITEETFEELLRIFKDSNIGTNNGLLDYLTTEKAAGPQISIQDNRTLDECPVFAAAERARMDEKNLEKAEKLYIQAIQAKEKPGSAVANLYQILIQKRKFNDCAMYLGLYGSKYMREEAYNNLKQQLLSIAPSMRGKIEKYEKEDENPVDYFVLAQKAELEEKDLQKAINYYNKAIEQKQRLSGSVPNLAAIYSRLEMFDEALALLNDTGKVVMLELSYLNLKITILSRAKNKKYMDEVKSTYTRMIEIAPSMEKKADLLFSEAYVLAQMEEYEAALEIFLKCRSECTPEIYSTREKYFKQYISILTGLGNAHYKLNRIEEAQKYAEEILTLDENNEFAQSILAGQMDEDADLMSENIGVTHINKYIKNKIEELSLDSEVKNKNLLEGGVFRASQEEAVRLIDAIKGSRRGSANDEAKSNQYLAGAKLIRQILDRDEDITTPNINEQEYLFFIAEGSCSYANSRLYRTELADNLDVARYFFIQTMTIFNDSEKIRTCWYVATIRYIQTFFLPLEEIRKEGNSLYSGNKDYSDCDSSIQKIMGNQIRSEIGIEAFTVAMIEFLAYNTRVKKQVLSCINANAFQGRILDILGKILESEVPDISTVKDFEGIWDDASKVYFAKRKAYLHLIDDTIQTVFAVGQLRENIEKLKTSSFQVLLNQTDKEYIKDLYEIFSTISRYNEISEFDYKAETLNRAESARKRLGEKIEEYPTFFSYEKLLPELEQLQVKIFKESSLLYGNSEPQLSVSLSGDSSVEEEAKIVRVPIAFTNRVNAQNADNVQISIVGDGVENINDTQLSKGLLIGNGRAKEEMETFRVSDKVLEEREFSIEIIVNYQYQKNMTEIEEASKKFVVPVPLYRNSEFEPIENKFEPHKNGSEVKDVNMFYGRDKDIESIIEQISDGNGRILQGRCLALYGQTRTGKSSLLYHLDKRLREMNADGNIIVNIGSIGEEKLTGNDITDFLYAILSELKHEILFRHTEVLPLLKEAEVALDVDKLLEDSEHSQLHFNKEFKNVCRVLSNQEKQYNIILMIDEFTYIYDWIRREIMTDRIMKFWKAFIQNNGIFAIIIGQDHMMRFINEQRFTNDFGSTDLKKITYLSEEDAKRLMYEPIMFTNEKGEKINRYKEGALDRLYELTSGSAFLIMNICAGLVDYLNEVHSVYITRAHIDDYLRKSLSSFEESRFFEPQYDDKSDVDSTEVVERNKKMLRKIAQQSNQKEWTPLQSVIQTEEDRKTMEGLELRDVVIVSNNERCKIKVALYKEWILERYGLEASYE